MDLRGVVQTYRALARDFGRPVPLKAFGLARGETECVFSGFDEDYHISRFFHFTFEPALADAASEPYRISGFAQTHVSLDAEITAIL